MSIAAALFLGTLANGTASAAPVPTPTTTTADSTPQILRGHTVPALAHATPLGPTDPTRQLQLTISLLPRNQQQLQAVVTQQSDRQSPGYQKYLTPQQFTAQFGPTQASVDAMSAYLVASGLKVNSVAPNRVLIRASGSVDAIQRAFQVQLQDFTFEGRKVHAPISEPSLPASVAGTVRGIIGLDDANKQISHVQRARKTSSPRVGSGPGGGYTPAELRTAYDMNALPNGAGQTIGVVEFSGYLPADIAPFEQQYGLGAVNITNRFVDGATIGGDLSGAIEVELDIDVLAGIAPGAAQLVYIAPNGFEADLYNQIVTDDSVRVVSSSWGICEPKVTGVGLDTMDTILTQGVAQGITFLSAAGDAGAFDCQGDLGNPLSVDFPGSDPNVVSVGGTALLTGAGGTYQSESVWNESPQSAGGGGLSTRFRRPSYQAGPGVINSFSNGMRETPDVSADADPFTGYSVYCGADDAAHDTGCDPSFPWLEVGGTSAATPLWAAMIADINQYLASQGKPGMGNAHNSLYQLFNTPQTFAAYHDITVGNNLVYPATAGYDMASGIGTPDAFNLARDLASAVIAAPVTTLVAPARLVDTRSAGGAIASGSSRCFAVVGLAGIPGDAAAVVLNVTAVGQTTNGWLTVFPSGQSVPATSTLNFGTSEYAMANGTIMRLGAGGQVCVNVGTVNSAPGTAQVILDATGFLPSSAPSQVAMLPSPVRLADTRTSGGSIGTGASRCFQVTGLGAIPGDAAAVVLNVTAVGYGTNGWLTAYPNGQSVPATSSVNFDQSEYAIANGTIMRIGTGGQVCVNVGTVNSAPGSSHVVLDATGYLTSTALVHMPMLPAPQRLVDTRSTGGPIATGQSRCFMVAGEVGVPVNASAVVLNVTAVGYGTKGWLTGYPNGQAVPATSTLNFDVSEYAIADGAIMAIGSSGEVCVNVGTVNSATGSAQVILDVVGYLTP